MKRGYAAQMAKGNIPIPVAPLGGISATIQQATGYFGIFASAVWAAAPHFLFKKDFIFHLDSSRAASIGEFNFKDYELYSKVILFF